MFVFFVPYSHAFLSVSLPMLSFCLASHVFFPCLFPLACFSCILLMPDCCACVCAYILFRLNEIRLLCYHTCHPTILHNLHCGLCTMLILNIISFSKRASLSEDLNQRSLLSHLYETSSRKRFQFPFPFCAPAFSCLRPGPLSLGCSKERLRFPRVLHSFLGSDSLCLLLTLQHHPAHFVRFVFPSSRCGSFFSPPIISVIVLQQHSARREEMGE